MPGLTLAHICVKCAGAWQSPRVKRDARLDYLLVGLLVVTFYNTSFKEKKEEDGAVCFANGRRCMHTVR